MSLVLLLEISFIALMPHTESSSENPPPPSASPEWVEFRKTVYETKPGRVRMTEEMTAQRK